jgi:hypothetical protein
MEAVGGLWRLGYVAGSVFATLGDVIHRFSVLSGGAIRPIDSLFQLCAREGKSYAIVGEESFGLGNGLRANE